MVYIVMYDIKFSETNDRKAAKRLNLVRKILKNYGLHQQKSIFECMVSTSKMNMVIDKVRDVLEETVDSFIVYPICEKCIKNIAIQGVGEKINILPYEIV